MSKENVESVSGKYVCLECDKSFNFYIALYQHRKKFHPSKTPTSAPTKIKNSIETNKPRQKKCIDSGYDKSYQKKKLLRVHLKKCDLPNSQASVSRQAKPETTVRTESTSEIITCTKCDEIYYLESELQQHMRECHPLETHHQHQTSVSVPAKTKVSIGCGKSTPENFICIECDKSFQHNCELQQHMRESHIAKSQTCVSIAERCALATSLKFACSECDKSYQHNYELQQHIKESHLTKLQKSVSLQTKIKTVEKRVKSTGEFTCSECGKIYQCNSELEQHMKESHSSGDDEECATSTSGMFFCPDCDKSYFQNRSLRRHIKETHPLTFQKSYLRVKKEKIYKRTVLCSLCEQKVEKKRYALHCETDHDMIIESERLHFSTFDDYEYWKETTENATYSRYILKMSKTIDKNGFVKSILTCHRSGYYVSRGEGNRNLKKQGSCKINGYCPASIILSVNKDTDECDVVYTKTHVGHEADIVHKVLSLNERQKIASKLASEGKSYDDIIEEIKESAPPDHLERIQLVTKKDLDNIKQCYKINVPPVQNHTRKRRKSGEQPHADNNSSETGTEGRKKLNKPGDDNLNCIKADTENTKDNSNHDDTSNSSEVDTPEISYAELSSANYSQTSQYIEERKVEFMEKFKNILDNVKSIEGIETLAKLLPVIQPTLDAVYSHAQGKSPMFQVLMTFPNN